MKAHHIWLLSLVCGLSSCTLLSDLTGSLSLNASDDDPRDRIKLSWNKAEESSKATTLDHFQLERDGAVIVASTTATSYEDTAQTGAAGGAVHAYKLTATYTDGSTKTATDNGFWLDEPNLLAGSRPGLYPTTVDLTTGTQVRWFRILVQKGWTYHLTWDNGDPLDVSLYQANDIGSALWTTSAPTAEAAFPAGGSGQRLLRVNFSPALVVHHLSLWYE